MKKVLVYPCGTEIGLEIYKALDLDIHYEMWGGSSSYDHGRFVYKNHIDNLPFIKDSSSLHEIQQFNEAIEVYNFDYIYPAMDGVLTIFSKYREYLKPVVIAPEYNTCNITRSKEKTYTLLGKYISVPKVFKNIDEIEKYPVFSKPDVGQGAVDTKKIETKDEAVLEFENSRQLIVEYLPGEEYTIDCFTNRLGKLVYAKARGRKRIKNGISVNATFCAQQAEFMKIAQIINCHIRQRGGWFFQVKEDFTGKFTLLEVASRIAGTSAITRAVGINLPLLTLNDFSGQDINEVIENKFEIELDRALSNTFKTDLKYKTVYLDYDDTMVGNYGINLNMVKFAYQCINNGIKLILLSKHDGDLNAELKKYRLTEIFDEVIHLKKNEKKIDFINPCNAIFIDDSYGERIAVYSEFSIPVFDIHNIDVLMEA